MTKIDALLEYTRDKRLGHYTVDPQRLGNGLRIVAHVQLPQLSKMNKTRDNLLDEQGLYESRPNCLSGDEFVYSTRSSLGPSELESFVIFQSALDIILRKERGLQAALMIQGEMANLAFDEMENLLIGCGSPTGVPFIKNKIVDHLDPPDYEEPEEEEELEDYFDYNRFRS